MSKMSVLLYPLLAVCAFVQTTKTMPETVWDWTQFTVGCIAAAGVALKAYLSQTNPPTPPTA